MTSEQVKHYNRCIAQGTSHMLAEMFALSQPPNGVSDQTYMRGHCSGSQFEKSPHMGNYYKHITEQHGGNTVGKRYVSGLARFPGDPEAWITGRDDVKRLVEKRGWGCEGTVNVKAREALNPSEPKTEVAEDLLNKYTQHVAEGLPDPERIDMADLKAQVKERISPKSRKKAVK